VISPAEEDIAVACQASADRDDAMSLVLVFRSPVDVRLENRATRLLDCRKERVVFTCQWKENAQRVPTLPTPTTSSPDRRTLKSAQ